MAQLYKSKQGAKKKFGKRLAVAKKPKKLTSLKNQIRAVERLLRKDGLNRKGRLQLESKLQDLQDAQKKQEEVKREVQYSLKYHKVKFFERVKLERKIKTLEHALQNGQEASAETSDELHRLHEDLQYVKHFPKGEKYVSILKDAADPEAQEKLVAERLRLRALVKRQLAELAMVTEAHEGLAVEPAKLQAVDRVGRPPFQEADISEDEDEFFLQEAAQGQEETVTEAQRPLMQQQTFPPGSHNVMNQHADMMQKQLTKSKAQSMPAQNQRLKQNTHHTKERKAKHLQVHSAYELAHRDKEVSANVQQDKPEASKPSSQGQAATTKAYQGSTPVVTSADAHPRTRAEGGRKRRKK